MLQIEIPHLASKAGSVKSFFDSVITQHKRFSFLGSSSSKIAVLAEKPESHHHNDILDAIPVQVSRLDSTPEQDQSATIRKVVAHLTSIMVEDDLEEKSCFIGSATPPITLEDYLERIVKYANQWAEDKPSSTSTGIRCIMVAVEYLTRSQSRLTPRSIHRYIMTAVLLAIKFTEDFAISNKFWGDVGGCKLEDVNRMEAALCIELQWRLNIDTDQFVHYQARLVSPSF